MIVVRIAFENSCTGPIGYGTKPIKMGVNSPIMAIKGSTLNILIVAIEDKISKNSVKRITAIKSNVGSAANLRLSTPVISPIKQARAALIKAQGPKPKYRSLRR